MSQKITANAQTRNEELAGILQKWLDKCEFDDVENPFRYNQEGIECFDVIKAMLGPREIDSMFSGFTSMCVSIVQKYVFRHRFKGNPLKDLKKAREYLNKAIEELEKDGFTE